MLTTQVSLSVWQTTVWTDPHRYKVLKCGRRAGKALSLDTKILTPDGFTTMGELKVGDFVFGQDGKKTKITYVSDVFENHDCYEVIFSNGEKIIADADHLWEVETKLIRKSNARNKKKLPIKPVTKKTSDMAADYCYHRPDKKFEANYSVKVAKPLIFPDKKLSFNPYVLGAWLGDGTISKADITVTEKEIEEKIFESGYELHLPRKKITFTMYKRGRFNETKKRQDNFSTCKDELEKIGVLNNKHIPQQYLFSGLESRKELLCGLMDTDGHIDKRGRCEFCSCNHRLASDVAFLIRSLGMNCNIKASDAKLYGRKTSTRYRLCFVPNFNCFYVGYKRARFLGEENIKNTRNYIQSIKKVESVKTKCIAVDNSDSLYLAGEKLITTHNTSLAIVKMIDQANKKPNQRIWYVAPCYDDKTEVLTQDGWKFFNQVKKTDKVAILDKGQLIFEVPKKIHLYPFDGELVGYKDDYIDMAVTPNHRCYVKKSSWKKKNNWVFKQADEIENTDGEYLFKKNSRWEGEHFANRDYFEFLGFWFADGSARLRKKGGEVVLTQKKRIDYVRKLLRSNKFNFSEQKRSGGGYNFLISSRAMAKVFVEYGKAYTKKVPDFVKKSSSTLIQAFLFGYFMGDGSFREDGSLFRATTVSKDLADDVQELALKAGWSANIRIDRNTYKITVLKEDRQEVKLYKKGWKKIRYTGQVGCVETRTGVVYVRRGGTSYWCGNTYRQAKNIVWEDLKLLLEGKYIKKNDTDLTLTLKNGTTIELKGSENVDALRGTRIDLIIFDEVAFMTNWDIIWKALRPVLADSKGEAWFISCVVKDTLILGENGLEEIGICPDGYSSENKNLFGLGGFHTAVNRYGSGMCPTKKIKTKFGFEIECTPNHKLWTKDGWKKSEDFRVGDQLLIQYGQQVFGNDTDTSSFRYSKRKPRVDFQTTWSNDLAYLMGLVLSEGSWSEHYLDITNADEQIQKFLINKFGFKKWDDFHLRLCSCKAVEFINWLGIPRGAKNKYIPEKILRLPKELLVEFLKGYFDGDGYADSKRERIGCVSASKKLIRQLQVLLLNFGILTKLQIWTSKPTKKVKVSSVGYRLTAENYAASVFFKEIGFRLKRKQKYEFERKNSYKTSFDRKDFGMLPSKFGYLSREKKVKMFTLEEILKLSPNEKYSLDMLCDEVVSVEDSQNYVYDFVIPQTHSYFTNGFVSHNTPNGFNHFKDLYEMEKTDKSYKSFSFTSFDNPFLDAAEIEDMRKEMSAEAFAQEVMAEFVKMAGIIYKDYSLDVHIGVLPELDTGEFTFIRSVDFGFRHKTAVLWGALSDRHLYIYDALYVNQMRTKDLAETIRLKDRTRKITYAWGDSAQPQILADLDSYGIHFEAVKKGADSVINGIQLVSKYLKYDANSEPILRIDKGLTNIAHKEFVNYHWVEAKTGAIAQEKPYKVNDDFLDALRYMIMGIEDVKLMRNQEKGFLPSWFKSKRNYNKATIPPWAFKKRGWNTQEKESEAVWED